MNLEETSFIAFWKYQEGLDYMRKYNQRNKPRAKKLRDNPENLQKRKTYNKKWSADPANKESKKQTQRKRHLKRRHERLPYMNKVKKTATSICKFWYGNQCQCECGCKERCQDLLTLAHVNNDGQEDRNTKEGKNLVISLVRNNFEHPAVIQLQCWNCNMGKKHNNNFCPRIKSWLLLQTPEGLMFQIFYHLLLTIKAEGGAIGPPGEIKTKGAWHGR